MSAPKSPEIAEHFKLAENRGATAKRWRTSLLHAIDDLEEDPDVTELKPAGTGSIRELIFETKGLSDLVRDPRTC